MRAREILRAMSFSAYTNLMAKPATHLCVVAAEIFTV
jgi:hypothetical protein